MQTIFMCFIFVVLASYENHPTTKITRFTVHVYLDRLEVILEKAESNVEWAELLNTGRADGGKGKGLPLDGEMLGLTEEEMRELEDRIDKMSNEGDKAEGKRVS